ncbi:hypothetical protein KDD93_00900 [Campylobacter sp. faydin G-24]|uniref:Uncharacterized protein n=1 Tax=Campylobacter anatolicus TaxID=2829105 RepID=A0ABS5HHZ2_9BACT|nr:hypothetical protein [Campylobacter anatolicus]MBR8462419.1 hypothetical protein [Campylobacter anatolicus]MBR8463132.1 hypothetical protein [Campylobacter anatolicus]
MNKRLCELFEKRQILLKNLQNLDVSEFSKKRSLALYFGVDTKSFYTLVCVRDAKSRLLLKEALKIDEICQKCEVKFNTTIKKRVLFYNSQICSKSLEILNKNGWRCYDFV